MNLKNFLFGLTFLVLISVSCKNQSEKGPGVKLNPGIESYVEGIEQEFKLIEQERKNELTDLAMYILEDLNSDEQCHIIFICTRNSRRSHMSQLWAQTAAYYNGIRNVKCYSGGTGATAFNPRSVRALKKAGFEIEKKDSSTNPVYLVKYAKDEELVKGFSKKFSHESNPQEGFIAVMTCSDADESCPLVPGANERIAIPYEDPKIADDTPQEVEKYDERCRQIAREMFYLFSVVKSDLKL